MVFNLGENKSIANQFLMELRDIIMQKDPMRFRKNMVRLGEIMAYEISKDLVFEQAVIDTPLSETTVQIPERLPILMTVMRAGLPFHQGFLNYFDQSPSGFIGAYRREDQEEITVNLDYYAAPSLEDEIVFLIDPMLATGKSYMKSIEAMLLRGKPKFLYIAAVVATLEGIAHLEKNIKIPFSIWTFAIDEKLNAESYIVPGLGDAGDLSFGEKL